MDAQKMRGNSAREQPEAMEFDGQESSAEVPPWNLPDKVTWQEKLEERVYYLISISPVFVTFGLYMYFLVYYVGVSSFRCLDLTSTCSSICIRP